MKKHFVIFLIVVLTSVTAIPSKPEERYLGETGVLTCNYTPPNALYVTVQWRYNKTGYDFTSADVVYWYFAPGTTGRAAGHLQGRSNHPHEPEQIKLFIYDLQDTDDGNYFCQILGSSPYRDNITYQSISECNFCRH